MKKIYNSFSLIETVKSLGIAKEVVDGIGKYAIFHFSLKNLQCEAINFADADACYDTFQDICLDYCYKQEKDKSLFVDFPNEFSDGHNEDFGNAVIVGKDNHIEDVYELVNPEYYE